MHMHIFIALFVDALQQQLPAHSSPADGQAARVPVLGMEKAALQLQLRTKSRQDRYYHHTFGWRPPYAVTVAAGAAAPAGADEAAGAAAAAAAVAAAAAASTTAFPLGPKR